MNKKDFLNELKYSLKQFSEKEVQEVINYYDEMISDRMESGMSEEAVVASLGNIKNIKAQIAADLVNVRLKDEDHNKNIVKTSNNFFIMLMFFISTPILIPIGIAFFSVFFSLFITMFALIVSFAAASICLIIGLIPIIYTSFIAGGAGGAVVSSGIILILIGVFALISILCTNIGVKFLNIITKTGTKIINKIAKRGKKNEI
jgi:uncharacterized membrane protein